MGSEGPKPVVIHVTGFKKFQGVAENPTETIVNNLSDFIEKRRLPDGVTLGSCVVLETAGDGALPMLYNIMESGIANTSSNEQVVWEPNTLLGLIIVGHVNQLHLGVNGGAHKFAIERYAVNEASFLCPDEMGWQPQQLPIVQDDGGTSKKRQTSCSVESILKILKKGYEVTASEDAGRFVCNYVYYHSLRYAEQKGHKSLFVHVPLFTKIDEETQMQFTASLLEAIGTTCL